MTETTKQTPMEAKEWRARVRDGEAPEDVLLHKEYTAKFKSMSEGQSDDSRVVDFVLNTGKADRYNDIVFGEGWDIENYLKNPVVLWAHEAGLPPVAKGRGLSVSGDSLLGSAEFYHEPGENVSEPARFANTVYNMVKQGFLNAVSVGFQPQEWDWDEDRGGFNFLRQELLEFSVVPIPADSDALRRAASRGVDVEPIRDWIIKTLDSGDEIVVPRAKLEAVVKGLGFGRGLKFFDMSAREIKTLAKGRVKVDPEYTQVLEKDLMSYKEMLEEAHAAVSELQSDNVKKDAQIAHLDECVQDLARGAIEQLFLDEEEKALESGSTILPVSDESEETTSWSMKDNSPETVEVINTVEDLAEYLFGDLEDDVESVESIVERRRQAMDDPDNDGIVVLRVIPEEVEVTETEDDEVLRFNPEELKAAINDAVNKKLSGIRSAFTKVTGQVL